MEQRGAASIGSRYTFGLAGTWLYGKGDYGLTPRPMPKKKPETRQEACMILADVGAEEGRAAKIDDSGNPIDFAINEKCAADAGAFIEAMARALKVTIEEMGPLCLQSVKEIPMNAQCVIFAESEVVGLIHAKTDKPDISKAIHESMAGRIVSMIRRIGVNGDIVMLEGVGCNPGFMAAMLRELKVEKIYIPAEPEYGAAAGAAVVAAEEA